MPPKMGVEPLIDVESDTVMVSGLKAGKVYKITVASGMIEVGTNLITGIYKNVRTVKASLNGTLALRVKTTSSLNYSDTVSASVTIKGKTSVFNVRTKAADGASGIRSVPK